MSIHHAAAVRKALPRHANGPTATETGHVLFSWGEVRPAWVNGQIYRPVDPSDPDVQALAEDIRINGLLQAIVITRDRVILSGHRRHVACGLAGLTVVPCQVMDIFSTDDNFVPLLVVCHVMIFG
jgi:hypothetical protein